MIYLTTTIVFGTTTGFILGLTNYKVSRKRSIPEKLLHSLLLSIFYGITTPLIPSAIIFNLISSKFIINKPPLLNWWKIKHHYIVNNKFIEMTQNDYDYWLSDSITFNNAI